MADLARLIVSFEAQTAKYEAGLKRMDSRLRRFERRQTFAIQKITRAFKRLGLALPTISFGLLARQTVRAGLAMERFERALKVATGSSEAAGRELQFVIDTSKELGLSLEQTGAAYSKLAAAARGTALQGKDTREIFIGISQAAVVLGLTAEQAGGALTAVEQIISKGKVSAEELRRQLGDRLPGAFQIAARSIGKTTAELDKMLRSGELTAEQLLPNLARELRATFGPEVERAATGAEASINRLKTSIFELEASIARSGVLDRLALLANALSGLIAPGLEQQIADTLEQINELQRTIAESRAHPESVVLRAYREQLEDLEAQLDDLLIQQGKLISGSDFDRTGVSDFVEKSAEDFDKLRATFVRQFETAEQEVERLLADFDLVAATFPPEEQERIRAAIKSVLVDGIEEVEVRVSERLPKKAKKGFDQIEEAARQAARNIQDAFADFLFDPFDKGVKGMLKAFIDALRRMVANQAATQLFGFIQGIFKGIIGGSPTTPSGSAAGLANLFPGRAAGGPVTAGVPFLVGERGPEVFVPNAAGSIAPNGSLGGATITHNITVNGADPARTAEILAPLLAQNREQTKADIVSLRRKGRL